MEVILVSTHARDRLHGLGQEQVVEEAGGPARYIGEALGRLDCPYRLFTGQVAQVEVFRTEDGEQYIIPELPKIPLPRSLSADAIILSPVMREIDPENLPGMDGMLVVDLQGFVREPSTASTNASQRYDLQELLAKASMVKAAKHELSLLDGPSLAELANTVLIVTEGARGVTVRQGDTEIWIASRPVPVKNTIGAGDTFLAPFVVEVLKGSDLAQAGTFAARFTEAFLEERLPENHRAVLHPRHG